MNSPSLMNDHGMNRFAHIWHTYSNYYCYGPLVHCRVFFFFALVRCGIRTCDFALMNREHWPLDHLRLREWVGAIIDFCPHPQAWLCFQHGLLNVLLSSAERLPPTPSPFPTSVFRPVSGLALSRPQLQDGCSKVYQLGDWAACFRLDDSRGEQGSHPQTTLRPGYQCDGVCEHTSVGSE